MLDYKPQVVHFCGHGEGAKGLVLEDESGKAKLVSTAALVNLFELFSDQVECVLLNACYSEVQARGIAQHIDSVIGMNRAIGDRAAIEFAVSFYDALGAGESVEFAFRLGRSAMQLAGIAEDQTPVLIPKPESTREAILAESGESGGSRKLIPVEQAVPQSTGGMQSRIFISYKRDFEPDESVVLEVFEALREQHEVFIDQTMLVGTRWAERIEQEIRRSDFLISFLSAHSVHSEMVQAEIETAHRLHQQQGKPLILPVRLAYQAAFVYPLSAYLNGINWALWNTPADTPRLLEELQRAIASNDLILQTDPAEAGTIQLPSELPPIPKPLSSAQPLTLEMPEGTMVLESRFYVERPRADAIALNAIQQEGVTLVIKGSRQMGKSSLLNRVMAAAIQAEKRAVFLDFQLLGSTLTNAADFFRQFCIWLTDELGVFDRVDEFLRGRVSPSYECTRFLERFLLDALNQPLMLAMDEVDSLFSSSFYSDFFAMLRTWHNNRATTPIWRRLDLALVTSTEPYLFIPKNQSPFNVGEVIRLNDFTLEQVIDLNQRHEAPLTGQAVEALMTLLGGHPYLVRRSLYLVANRQLTGADLFAQATSDQGPFSEHLRRCLFQLNEKPDLMQEMRQIIQQQTCSNEKAFWRLEGAGLVRRDGQTVMPRCQLYANYFQERLRG